MQNTGGGITRKGFDVTGQPSNASKIAGWARKRQAQGFMDKIVEYQDLTLEEFELIGENMEHHKDQFTVRDMLSYSYAAKLLTNDKFMLDWVEKHIGKSSKNFEGIEKDLQKLNLIKVVIVKAREEIERLEKLEKH